MENDNKEMEGSGVEPKKVTEPGGTESTRMGTEVSVTNEMVSQNGRNPPYDLDDIKPPLIDTSSGATGHRRIGALKMKSNTQTAMSGISSPTAMTAAPRKYSMLLSNEAKKEMVKQAKALKEERRATLDIRHKYLIVKLADTISLGEMEVEEALISDDKFSMIEDFFSAHGSKRLLFYYQEVQLSPHGNVLPWMDSQTAAPGQKRLFITTGTAERLNGACLFFLRNTDKAITTANVSQEVNFGMLDCTNGNFLQSLERFFTQVTYPALRSHEDWGVVKEGQRDSFVQDFLLSIDKFICSLSSARKNLENKFQLERITCAPELSHLQEPADFSNAASNSELVERLELVLLCWTKQIEQVLTESEQMRKEADNIGPSVELEHWKKQMMIFNSVLDEMKQPEVKKVMGVLQVARSKALNKWKEMDENVTFVANEAKDNVKYLYTLEKFFKALGKCTPTNMLAHIPSLLNSILLIQNVSYSYNTSEHMTSIFVKVTNQMVSTCKEYLSQGVTKFWDLDRKEMLTRISECLQLNQQYRRCFQKIWEDLQQNPTKQKFEFSDNYVFGKFDTFCKRLENIADLTTTLETLSALQLIKLEGIEKVHVRFQTIINNIKSKTYNMLDQRKTEFDSDYAEFKGQIQGLYQCLYTLLDTFFQQPHPTEQKLHLLLKFENTVGKQMDLSNKYAVVLQHFVSDLEQVRKVYKNNKDNPPMLRILPPVAGKIIWSRHLFRKLEMPMEILKRKMDILMTPEGKKVIHMYNKLAAVLLEYELLYHRAWVSAVERGQQGLNASLLIRHPQTKEICINLDPVVLEVLEEAKYMQKLGAYVPKVILSMYANKAEVKNTHNKLVEMLEYFGAAVSRIPALLQPLIKPFINRVEMALSPGFTILSWTSLNINTFIKHVYEVLRHLEQIVKATTDILDCRIEQVLEFMSCTDLLALPEDKPVVPQCFLIQTESTVRAARQKLSLQSQQVENSMYELFKEIKRVMRPADIVNVEEPFQCLHPDVKLKTRCLLCIPCSFYMVMGQLCHKNTEALVKATKHSLDSLRCRIYESPKYQSAFSSNHLAAHPPLFRVSIELAIPSIILKPSLEEMQSVLSKVVTTVLSMAKDIPLWKFSHLHHKQQQVELQATRELADDGPATKQPSLKPLDRQIAEHKDIIKTVVQLNSIIFSLKLDPEGILDDLSYFSTLWKQDPAEQVKAFLATNPSLPEFSSQLSYYSALTAKIEDLPTFCTLGFVLYDIQSLKLSLTQECRAWKRTFGIALNQLGSTDMSELSSFVDGMTKQLQRPISDLEDVRETMDALKKVREAEIWIEATIGPVEETFALLNRHELQFSDGNAERVDTLTYGWKTLKGLVMQTHNTLELIHPTMKAELLTGVKSFQAAVKSFYDGYDKSGPGVVGLTPREASDRLQVFQVQFDELWRKYITFSSGEQLFGLTVNEYPDLHRIKKELNLLSKLYSLYNCVIESVNGYSEILWADLNIEKINSELQDFQNRIRKLPKALKEWQAFNDLKKKIDDFNETCPLLQMMANKAMLPRHWQRLSDITGYTFEVDHGNFILKKVLEAPLLKNKEDIEDVCISAVKERDIEAKLKDVVAEWSSHQFTFAPFRNRGELLLKGSDTREKVTLIEDSLMVLGSLMSNRYNAPFKATIQQWVQKLSNSSEVIEKWLSVQNLWLYLEAVFVGGDIAKQLPQEAKRFQNIDKSWQRIMQRAHEVVGVVQCCVGDDTLSQLLPHLLEQLEVCQKSLSGYLEKKRLVFPRFFFVSDPVLLEILGQASDPHTIQNHLLSLFDNVNRVVFHEKNYDQILSFQSQEGESVNLSNPVNVQGNVETWLGLLLDEVRRTIHSIIRNAHMAVSDPGLKLTEFQSAFPAQVGLLGIQIIWTRDAEKALSLSKADKKIMQATNQRFLDILNELIDMTTHDLTKMERTKYETLITIHVHQKDIFDDLVKMNIRSKTDFEWQKQSRFYFDEDTDRCMIHITDVEFDYCNEYLGCTDRLVITPLTDRCYITLAQALGMGMGGAPAGPAGTGKTETTKDMGRCLGKYVVVFNCSDQMDYRGLGRIYKGLAQSGAWGCFDEFNRIELPVLSVAAQQIYIVLQCKKNNKPQFIFTDGDVVDMDKEFGIFLTMNPGYAGRQELPENLKIQFRIVAMMVPDRAIIMRVKLASAGFRDNQVLSRKFYTLYKLCEEQLSKQVHYDFGLRNILSVLRTLGAVKRSNPSESEKTVVMRVLRDMNLSKLVDEDEPLFLSLINDLFPGISLDKVGYPELEAAISTQAEEAGLIAHPPWMLKLVQLYETQRVRHGIMTLGPSGTGKTTCIHTLLKAMTNCGTPHKEMRMNPKAITASQMFGTLDVATNDWTDGVFSTLWRKTLKAKKGECIWIVLDGPVDAVWIENLNSVLDDNKTLTLANGDRIPMSPYCKVVFEPHNIDNASPATVSRNGMVFMSSSVLDWRPILQAWLKKIQSSHADVLLSCFNSIYQDLMNFVFTAVSPKMQILECMYIKQTIDILQGLLVEEKNLTVTHVSRLFVFAVMWSVGALLELEDRAKMEVFLRNHSASLNLPSTQDDQTIFEYVVSETGEWEPWSNKVQEYHYPKDTVPDYASILVPNVDNTRTDFLLQTLMKQGKAVLLIGEQGTGKTVMIKGYTSKYNPETHLSKSLNFSSATLPSMFQQTIESYIDKRMGTTYGPPAGKKMTVFIDDINMPVINEWGDQITNEIVRQLMEQGGFYSLDRPGKFISVVDLQLIAAMIHPGGGCNDIPQRLKRQFCVFNCTLPSNSSIDKIFHTLASGYFCPERGFTESVCFLATALVPTIRKVWQTVKMKMLPSPAKFHYIFNLRDLSRIWQGILTIGAEVCKDKEILLSLFRHECGRVIADRFIDQNDSEIFDSILERILLEDHGTGSTENNLWEEYFVDFLRDAPEIMGDEPEDSDILTPKIYEPIPSFAALSDRLALFLQQYNESMRGAPMDLVFFKDAMIHLVKISRIIRTPEGNALLVGVGGSGKQSLTRLASFIAGYQIFQITLTRTYNVSNLMEDLKTLYRIAGVEGKGVTFIFTDNDVKDESFLEYMNNLVASGEVSNLFARDEIDEITQYLIPFMKRQHPRMPPTSDNLYSYFLSRVRSNLHVVLCFSPVGEKLRSRALRFPGLISGCTVDWFQRWPKDALVAVAQHFLASYPFQCSENVKKNVISTMGTFQDLVAQICIEYYQRYRRQTYVTPKSYLSFIKGYQTIYHEKIGNVGMLAKRMNTGLDRLMEAEQAISQLSKELVVKEQELEVASHKADVVLQEVTVKAQAAEKVKTQVQKVKDKAQAIVDEIAGDKKVAEAKLEAAKPALDAAEAALQTIKPSDIATVRKLGKPPHLIMRIMDCVLLLFQRRVDTVTMDTERFCLKPSWSEALKLMNNSGFLGMLLNFNKDTITEEVVELLVPYLNMDDYNLEAAKRICGNVAGLCSWTEAMVDFFSINKEVLPLKANLKLQEARLGVAQDELCRAQEQLDEKQKELDEAQALYDGAVNEKQSLLDDAESCRRKMSSAMALIDGLSGEKIRWTESSTEFQRQIKHLMGDVLLATGFLSYAGPFNQEYRNHLLEQWKKEMNINSIPYSQSLNVISMLVDNVTIGEWNLQALPNDELSVQNGIIVTGASRYPLLIDPQGQGKTWIKNRESNNELQVTSLDHKYFRTHLENTLSLGKPLLIEDVGEELDPVLDNVLEKNFTKSGSTYRVKIGDKEVDVMKGFTLYITTKLANPTYSPEISAKTAVVDFTVTMRGLEDQLLGRVILKEKQEMESERVKLVVEVTSNKRKMQELEDNLLYKLTSTQGSLVEDKSLVDVLRVTKSTAEEVREKLSVAAETEIKINHAREEYRPIATRGSILYFLIVEMSLVNVMYQTSLRQFLDIFDNSLEKSPKSQITQKRLDYIMDFLTYEVFRYTVRGLYEDHKFLFTLLLALKIDLQAQNISHSEFHAFIKGGASLDLNSVEPKPKRWILDMTWLNLVQLSNLHPFSKLLHQVACNDRVWKSWFEEAAPEDAALPDGYDSLDAFHKLLLIRSWCPDRTIAQARRYVTESIGHKYAEGVILDMDAMYTENDKRTPIVCLLSMGSDPTENIQRLAKTKGVLCQTISMGQGQEVHARRLLTQSMSEGGWLLLQNCHLGLDFLDELLESLTTTETVHDNFKVWVTTDVHPKFPINFLQSSIKFTNEPPQGVKAGLRRTYSSIAQEQLEITNMPQWKPLLYAVAFLHTTVQERRKFGPLGWNIPYEFNQADFTSSVQFVQNHLDVVDAKLGVNWNCLRYMLGEVQYGGRVTDDMDKRLLNTFTRIWFSESTFEDKFCFYKGYTIPKVKMLQEYHAHIDTLPLVDTPEVFGLHSNAEITCQTNMATEILNTIISIQPKDSSGGGDETRESTVLRLASEMLEKLPADYVPYEVRKHLQKMGLFQPMTIFLRQEIDRMQHIIGCVRSTLTDLKYAIDGTIVMSEDLQDALDSMYDARVPKLWQRISWESATLGFWYTELLERNQQFHSWTFGSRPHQFWLTGFFNPQGFLTAMRQETTRANLAKGWALDTVVLLNNVTRLMREDVTGPPPGDTGGVYIYGLFLDGAGWDKRNSRLAESSPKVLFTPMPVVHVYAVSNVNMAEIKRPQGTSLYTCPVYRKPKRTDLNFIFNVFLQSIQNPDHWTLRGVALLCDCK
ncbi:dynein axonemal heavy chain 5 [Clarias gariepinus]|nr:dynein axonemal heavy chain 5 [Clarias gariepinus]